MSGHAVGLVWPILRPDWPKANKSDEFEEEAELPSLPIEVREFGAGLAQGANRSEGLATRGWQLHGSQGLGPAQGLAKMSE